MKFFGTFHKKVFRSSGCRQLLVDHGLAKTSCRNNLSPTNFLTVDMPLFQNFRNPKSFKIRAYFQNKGIYALFVFGKW